jgi:hypothetical protein
MTRKGMIVLLSVLLTLICLPQAVIGSDWVCIDPPGEVCTRYYDKENIKYYPGNIVRVSLKVIVDEGERNRTITERTENGYPVDGWDQWSHMVFLDEFVCITRIYRTLNSVEYDTTGKVLQQSEYQDRRWTIIPPDTVEHRIYSKVCPLQKEGTKK